MQMRLAALYYYGLIVPQDFYEAVKWCTKAANMGAEWAQIYLSRFYFEGAGVLQDYRKSAIWISKAAEQGNAYAQFELGWMYYFGQGVTRDYVQAYKWWNLSAAQSPSAFYGDAAEFRDSLERGMTQTQMSEAQRLSREFRPKKQDQRTEGTQTKSRAEIKGSGTGFFITTDGYLLTAYHVVEDATRIQLLTNKDLKPAIIVRADTVNDIALLKVEGWQCKSLTIQSSRDVKVGEEVFTLGFPNIQLQGTEAKYTYGHINSLSGFADDPRLFQISVAIQPGNSGGPLLNSEGLVVGLVVAKLDEIATARETGSLPQNVNYALKSSFVLSFLEALPQLSGKLPKQKKDKLTRTQLVKNSADAVAMVLCY